MEWIPSPNFNSGRGGKSIGLVVIHWFGMGTIDSAIGSFQNPVRQASAHYLISDDRLVQMVKEENTAWHAGVYDINQRSVGIEHDANPEKDLSEASYQTSGKLLREICERHGIPLDREHIKGHNEFKATQCPGTIDINKIINIAKGDNMSLSKVDLVRNQIDWFYRTFLHVETEEELMSHVNNVLATFDQTTNGNSLRTELESMAKSPEFQGKWMLKADCKPTVCPPNDCTSEVNSAVEKETSKLMNEHDKFVLDANEELKKRSDIISALSNDLSKCQATQPPTIPVEMGFWTRLWLAIRNGLKL